METVGRLRIARTIPGTPQRTIAAVLLLLPVAGLLALDGYNVVKALERGLAPEYIALGLALSLLRYEVWLAIFVAWDSGRYFRADQTIQLEDGLLTVTTKGLWPPSWRRRSNVGQMREPRVQVIRYRKDSADPSYRPSVYSRLRVGLGSAPLLHALGPFDAITFGQGLTLKEAEDLAALLNADLHGTQRPEIGEHTAWVVEGI